MFPALQEAVERLSIPLDGRALEAVLALRDRLEATIAEAVGAFDAASLWDVDLATSMTAWLRQSGLSRRDAARLAGHAKRLRSLPVTAGAWRAGELSSGQVDTILSVVGERHVERFADHEAALVPVLAPLGMQELSRVMAEWRAKADALAPTWAPDGRATFRHGGSVREREAHIIWRRIASHDILKQP